MASLSCANDDADRHWSFRLKVPGERLIASHFFARRNVHDICVNERPDFVMR
jgi:hypothetical protein